MKKNNKYLIITVLSTIALIFGFTTEALAATTPSLGDSATFGILSSSYTNTTAGTTINGDLGYTTGPATTPTVTGNTHAADSVYNQAGIDQGTALTNLSSQPCTYTFPNGPIDLAADTTHGTVGVYTPGVYCTGASSAASIGSGGITLSGTGTFIFRINGALTTNANSVVTLANGASACNVFWTPTAATTLGANSTFGGTDIDASGITIGSTVIWPGRALAFGGTVSTTSDTITVPTCAAANNTSGAAGSGTTSSGTTAASTIGAPDTGFGVYFTNPWRELEVYTVLASGILVLAFVIRHSTKPKY